MGSFMTELVFVDPWYELVRAGRRYYRCERLNESDTMPSPEDRTACTAGEANLVGSLCEDGLHRPVLDIDIPAALVPSSTPGHHHLYLNVGMSFETYLKLVQVLVEAGVVSKFYAVACQIRGQSFCRVPWVKKEKTL